MSFLLLARRYAHFQGRALRRISPLLHQRFPFVHSLPLFFNNSSVHFLLLIQASLWTIVELQNTRFSKSLVSTYSTITASNRLQSYNKYLNCPNNLQGKCKHRKVLRNFPPQLLAFCEWKKLTKWSDEPCEYSNKPQDNCSHAYSIMLLLCYY